MQKIRNALNKSFVISLDERDAEQLARLYEVSGRNQAIPSFVTGVASKKVLNNKVVKLNSHTLLSILLKTLKFILFIRLFYEQLIAFKVISLISFLGVELNT